jgi:hypothetical protein
MKSNSNENPGRRGMPMLIRPACRPALALAAAVLATGFAATASTASAASAASAAPAATGAAAAGRPAPATFVPAGTGEKVTVTSHFLLRPTTASTSGDSTFMDNGATNNKKNDLLFVMPNLSPGGVDPCPCLLDPISPVGVWYNGSQWAVFNEDGSDIGTLMNYNVLVVPKASKSAFTVHATSPNVHGDYVIINSTLTNGHPDALLQVTQIYGSAAVFNPNSIGVRYFKVRRRWAIFNEDGSAMPPNASFNVLVGNAASNGGRTALLTTTAANRPHNEVIISNSQTTGNPNNVVFATQDFNPSDKGGTGNTGNVIAAYDNTNEGLANWAGSASPLKAAFNLLIFSS